MTLPTRELVLRTNEVIKLLTSGSRRLVDLFDASQLADFQSINTRLMDIISELDALAETEMRKFRARKTQ